MPIASRETQGVPVSGTWYVQQHSTSCLGQEQQTTSSCALPVVQPRVTIQRCTPCRQEALLAYTATMAAAAQPRACGTWAGAERLRSIRQNECLPCHPQLPCAHICPPQFPAEASCADRPAASPCASPNPQPSLPPMLVHSTHVQGAVA